MNPKELMRIYRIASRHKQSSISQVVYHGTDIRFDQFQHMEGTRSTTLGNEWKVNSGGFFFADSVEDALVYGDHVVECRITIRNPLAPREQITGWTSAWPEDKRKDAAYIFQSLLETDSYGRVWLTTGLGAKVIGWADGDQGLDSYLVDDLGWVDNLAHVPWMALEATGVVERMRERGYDGTALNEPDTQEGFSYFVLNPEQIEILRWVK